DHHQQHDQAHRPVGNTEERENLGGDLHQQPASDRVGDRHAIDVTALQLLEEIGLCHAAAHPLIGITGRRAGAESQDSTHRSTAQPHAGIKELRCAFRRAGTFRPATASQAFDSSRPPMATLTATTTATASAWVSRSVAAASNAWQISSRLAEAAALARPIITAASTGRSGQARRSIRISSADSGTEKPMMKSRQSAD